MGAAPADLRKLPLVMSRVAKVRDFRLNSTAAPTRKAADSPTLFFFVSQPSRRFVLIPEVSSERRKYIPLGFMEPDIIASNKLYVIDDPSTYVFGVLQSLMHMAWVQTVSGRLKSDIQYSASMVYNTFPWPDANAKQRESIGSAAQYVLDTRCKHPGSTLADLYDPVSMPPDLVKAHQTLDHTVDAAYGRKDFKNEAERVAFLFERYQLLAAPLDVAPLARRKRARAAKSPQA
jgi:hypothetical protein